MFNKIDGSVFQLDKRIDTICYIKDNSVIWTLIFFEKEFEEIFHVRDKIIQETSIILNNLTIKHDFLELDESVQKKCVENIPICKKIIKLSRTGIFDNIKLEILKQDLELRKGLSIKCSNNILKLSNNNEFKEFLNLCDGHYVNDIKTPDVTEFVPYKKNLNSSSKSTEEIIKEGSGQQ